MNIVRLELLTVNLQTQQDFYASVLGLPVNLTSSGLEVNAGQTEILFTPAPPDFDGAYHFAFNIPENKFRAAKGWISNRVPLLRDASGNDEFPSESWDSDSVYFKDAAGNILEFIARHNLKDAAEEDFDGSQILCVSEIGLPSDDVLGFADELCTRLGLSVFKQKPNENFTPVGDEHGLLILPAKDRIWKPDSGVPAKLLPVRVQGEVNIKRWEVRGMPYEIMG
ncbi:MAG TPA: hypothetical protein VKP08_04610 [Anaerolineales bacterium]|nr:hypothetical protein [Anaerolineales bacterium]